MSHYKMWRYKKGDGAPKGAREQEAIARMKTELLARVKTGVSGLSEKETIQQQEHLEHCSMTDADWWVYIDNCLSRSI